MRNRNAVTLIRIANGYNVVVPSYDSPYRGFNPDKEEEDKKGNYIPQEDSVFFKETLKDVFDFLTEIEKNPQPENNIYPRGVAMADTMVG